MGPPGGYHEPLMHNYKINPNPDSQFVTGQDALAFKNYMAGKKSFERNGGFMVLVRG